LVRGSAFDDHSVVHRPNGCRFNL